MTAPTDEQTERRLKAARVWYDAKCCVVPAAADGSKKPAGFWKNYQTQRPAWPVLQSWLKSGDYDGFGIICGDVSGNLEMFEIEGRAADLYDKLGFRMMELGYAELWFRVATGYLERTPSGGFHFLLRVSGTPKPNLKLARRPATPEELAVNPDDKVKVLLETRGEGGFTVVAPSGGRTHPSGQEWERIDGTPANIPVLTEDERDIFYEVARSFDQMPVAEPREQREYKERSPGDPLRPGDDFNLRATWDDILTPQGWTYCYDIGGARAWRRPGKDVGISATTGRNDGDNLYVFSSSTPFETETAISKFHAYAVLHHGGDFSAAARDLGRQGYGEQRSRREPEPDVLPPAPAVEDAATPSPVAPVPAAMPPVGVTEAEEEAFWSARPVLQHIRTFARARRTAPWATLGICLARVITAVPPGFVLPPLVGNYASLNLFVALVGPSGAGKGAAEGAASGALDVGEVHVAHVGSGEGIAHLFAHREKDQVVRDRDAVLFKVPEVDNLTALGNRQGATLMPQLRSAWSGEQLGFAYVDKNKTLPLGEHTYRLSLSLGVQPLKAGPLLEDADGGTPQRFLWMPTTDPGAPEEAPEEPATWTWSSVVPTSAWHADTREGYAVVSVPDSVRRTVAMQRLTRLRGEKADLDSHATLARLKVAAALALLDERRHISEEDWQLADVVMRVSGATRQAVVDELSDKFKRSNEARGEAEAGRAVLVADRVAEAAAQRVARRVVGMLAGGPMRRGDVQARVAARDRQYLDEAIDRLVTAGQVAVEGDGKRAVYSLRTK